MARWVNNSGGALSVPAVGRDVDDGEEIEVDDSVLLPANHFSRVEKADKKSAGKSSSKNEEG